MSPLSYVPTALCPPTRPSTHPPTHPPELTSRLSRYLAVSSRMRRLRTVMVAPPPAVRTRFSTLVNPARRGGTHSVFSPYCDVWYLTKYSYH